MIPIGRVYVSKKHTHPDHEVMEDVAAHAASAEPETVDAEARADEQPDLAAQLERVQAQADEYLDSLQRERATFQNFKKRVERERGEQAKAVAGDVLVKLLPVLDDFYRAVEAVPEHKQDDWYNGMLLILRKLERFLAEQDVHEIEALGVAFDPNFHEAVGVDGEVDAESGTITQVMLRGYTMGDRVLRPAMVRVAQ